MVVIVGSAIIVDIVIQGSNVINAMIPLTIHNLPLRLPTYFRYEGPYVKRLAPRWHLRALLPTDLPQQHIPRAGWRINA